MTAGRIHCNFKFA